MGNLTSRLEIRTASLCSSILIPPPKAFVMSVPLLKYQSRCPSCGRGVKSGFQMKRHRAECGSRPQERPEHRDTDGDHHDTDGDCEYHDADVAPDVSTAPSITQTEGLVCPPDAPVVAHFNAQKDSPGLGQCMGWGPRILTPQEKDNFRFLQVVDAGSGASGRVAQGMLSHARRLGGNGLLLPRTMRACWASVAKKVTTRRVLPMPLQI